MRSKHVVPLGALLTLSACGAGTVFQPEPSQPKPESVSLEDGEEFGGALLLPPLSAYAISVAEANVQSFRDHLRASMVNDYTEGDRSGEWRVFNFPAEVFVANREALQIRLSEGRLVWEPRKSAEN